jgi:hypothetical protein
MTDDDDEPESEWRSCRVCSGEDLFPDEQHNCLYAGNPQMSADDERALLAALEAAPPDTWHPSAPWATDEHKLGDWTVRLFFDGVDVDDLDYIECAVAPDGMRYEMFPGSPDVGALPMSIVNWRPQKMGPVECVKSAMRRAIDRFAAIVSQVDR